MSDGNFGFNFKTYERLVKNARGPWDDDEESEIYCELLSKFKNQKEICRYQNKSCRECIIPEIAYAKESDDFGDFDLKMTTI